MSEILCGCGSSTYNNGVTWCSDCGAIISECECEELGADEDDFDWEEVEGENEFVYAAEVQGAIPRGSK